MKYLFYILCLTIFTGCTRPVVSPDLPEEECRFAVDGVALMSVVVATNAHDSVSKVADDLAVYLGKITGGHFAVTNGDGTAGIAVGLAADFPALDYQKSLDGSDVANREAYVISTHAQGVHIIGATDMAVEDAVWDLLYRLGYRQFFPGETWECIPKSPDLSFTLNIVEKPDYYTRRIWYGYGLWNYNAKPYNEWCIRNRARYGFRLSTGHAYDGLIRHNKKAFEEHPEYYGLVGGERKSSKLCIGNPDLRQLICNYAVQQFDKNPDMDCISMDPSDGGNWCECKQCAALGSVSDQAVTLANAVAEAINKKHNDKYVGMYAYNYHSPSPGIEVHPNVIISCATAFIKGGLTLDEIIKGWSDKGATIGVREYYSVNTWSRDMPGRARGGNLDYLTRTIPEFYSKGARFMSAESGDCWGPNGLGYYLASRILWSTNEAVRVDAIVQDFMVRAFGPAAGPMTEFYKQIDGSNRSLVFDDQLGRMFRSLKQAKMMVDTPEINARLNDLILYARYVELYDVYRNSKGAARQQAFETVIRHAYRMRKTMMIHTKALYRDLVSRDKGVSIPEGAAWSIPEDKNPWKSSEPFSEQEFSTFLENGIAAHDLVEIDFESIEYSDELVPAALLNLKTPLKSSKISAGRGFRQFYTWVDNAPSSIELQITGGLITWYRDRGNVKIDLFKVGGESDTGERETMVAHDESVPPDGNEYTVSLPVKETGLYKITVSDGGDRTLVAWPAGTPMTVVSTIDNPARLGSRWTLHFYVPKNTPVIGFYADGAGSLLDPNGKVVMSLGTKKANFYSIPVPKGQDGALWTFSNTAGSRRLMTVPPCMARSAAELLLPREVVEQDATQ